MINKFQIHDLIDYVHLSNTLFRILISPLPYGKEEGTWGDSRKCKKGSHAIGAEIALHDDYGLSNLQHVYEDNPHQDKAPVSAYLASIVNIRLICSGDDEDKDGRESSVIEGNLHNFWDGNTPNDCNKLWCAPFNLGCGSAVFYCIWDKLLYQVQNRQKQG